MEKATIHQPEKLSHSPVPANLPSSAPRSDYPLFSLQRAVGNQAVGRLLESGIIQAKLRVSQPGDADEQEADRIAEKVVAGPGVQTLHRKCGCSGGGGTRCAQCEMEESQSIHRKAQTASDSDSLADNSVGSLGLGQALDSETRQSMESRFGHDFGHVRIHTDESAAASARSVNALAYTLGNNIVFDKGQYQTGTSSGLKLLAHELTHVVQQGDAGRRVPPSARGHSGNSAETASFHNDKVSVTRSSPPGIARQGLGGAVVPGGPPPLPPSVLFSNPSAAAAPELVGGAAPEIVTGAAAAPEVVTAAAAPEIIAGTAGAAPEVVGGVATGTSLGLGAILAPLAGVVAFLWPNTSIVSGDEERRMLEAARRATPQPQTRPQAQPQTQTQPQAEPIPQERRRTCATDHPGVPLCSSLPSQYTFRSPQAALNALKTSLHNPSLSFHSGGARATGGPCPGIGTHYNVRFQGQKVASITCCPCCLDTPNGPVTATRCRIV